MADLVQTLVTSVTVGSLYALIALGYTMVYGILKFINFAHSDIVVLGAWTSFRISSWLASAGAIPDAEDPVPPLWIPVVVLLASMILCGAVGFLIEYIAYRPLRRAPRVNVLITAIGVSLLLQNAGQLDFLFGASPVRMPTLLPARELVSFSIGSAEAGRTVVIGLVDVLIVVASSLLMISLEFVVYHTRHGTAMRAVAQDPETAALQGISVDRVVSVTFVAGSVLAAAAGFLYVMKYPAISQPAHSIWVLLGLKAFVAAVVGGIGNVRGALAGGYIIATIEQFGAFYVSSGLRDVYVFGLLILMLLIRPSGLLGSVSSTQEKV